MRMCKHDQLEKRCCETPKNCYHHLHLNHHNDTNHNHSGKSLSLSAHCPLLLFWHTESNSPIEKLTLALSSPYSLAQATFCTVLQFATWKWKQKIGDAGFGFCKHDACISRILKNHPGCVVVRTGNCRLTMRNFPTIAGYRDSFIGYYRNSFGGQIAARMANWKCTTVTKKQIA